MNEPAPPAAVGSSEGLGPPAVPRRWYCNKCGHLGEAGPEHYVCAGYPEQRCQYSAVAWGPFWSSEQLAMAEAAERKRWRGAVLEMRERLLWLDQRADTSAVDALLLGPNV